jgi:hypothetical protein
MRINVRMVAVPYAEARVTSSGRVLVRSAKERDDDHYESGDFR